MGDKNLPDSFFGGLRSSLNGAQPMRRVDRLACSYAGVGQPPSLLVSGCNDFHARLQTALICLPPLQLPSSAGREAGSDDTVFPGLWLLSKTSSALSSCSPPPDCLKGKPSCTDVCHNHVDSSANSALKAIAFLILSLVTIVPSLSSNLPAYLGSALVEIMPINGCCGFRFVIRLPPLHAQHLPPRTSCIG